MKIQKKPVQRRKTRSDDAIQWMRDNGGFYEEAAGMFGLTRQAVHYRWLALYPDKPTPREANIQARRDKIVELINETKTAQEIEQLMGLTSQLLKSDLRAIGINVTTRLDEKRVRLKLAISEVAAGGCIVDVAAKAGISAGYLGNVTAKKGVSAVRHGHHRRRDGRIVVAASMVLSGCSHEQCNALIQGFVLH